MVMFSERSGASAAGWVPSEELYQGGTRKHVLTRWDIVFLFYGDIMGQFHVVDRLQNSQPLPYSGNTQRLESLGI